MQVLCPYYVKDHMKAIVVLTDGWFYLLNLSSVNRF